MNRTVRKNKLVAPVVKWVGGKRQLIPEMEKYFPNDYGRYYEPFVGGGAVLFYMQPRKANISDSNKELVNLYKVIMENPTGLIVDLSKHRNEEDYFYSVRGLDRDKDIYSSLSDVERASRLVFLNKTCYNGLFRVNSSGEFNSPFGRYRNPNIVNDVTIKALSEYFSNPVFFHPSIEEIIVGACHRRGLSSPNCIM